MVIGITAAVVIIIALLVKIYLLKKAAREISEGLAEKLSSDTNTVIDISSAVGAPNFLFTSKATTSNGRMRESRIKRKCFIVL